MIEFKVQDLSVGDEYTQDHGDTWWKVESIVQDHGADAMRINATCVGSQVSGIDVGSYESGPYDHDTLVVVR